MIFKKARALAMGFEIKKGLHIAILFYIHYEIIPIQTEAVQSVLLS